MVIRLVDEDRHRLRDAVEQRLHLILRDDQAGRVVRVAQIHEPDLALMIVGGLDHRRDVLRVVLVERQLDRRRLDARGVLIDRAVRRLDTEHFLAAQQIRGADDVEDFTGAGAEQDVLGLDAVVLRDLGDQVAIRIPVAVRVLPGVVHRLHDRFRRPPAVLVAGEMRDRIVVVVAAHPRHGVAGGAGTVLGEQVRGRSEPQVPQCGGKTTKEIASGNVVAHGSSDKSCRPNRGILARTRLRPG